MTALRYQTGNTSQNVSTLLGLLNDTKTDRVILFASPTERTADMTQSDGPETNLPLVAALAEFTIPGISSVYVVFDGLFLTAARYPRFMEVRTLLDSAVQSGKAFFASERASFTSALTPDVAAEHLLKLGPLTQLTSSTRPAFFSLLSSLKESEYA